MKIVALRFCLVSLSHGQTCTSQWSNFKDVTEGPFYSQEAYGFSVKRTTNKKCENGRLYLRTNLFLLRPVQIKSFIYNDWLVLWIWILLWSLFLQTRQKTYSFQYINKNCDRLQLSIWFETVSCQTSSHAVYARRRCVDCDGVDYPDRRYCYGSETKQIPCRNLILTDINPSEHSNTNKSTNCNNQSCIIFPNLTLYVIIGGVVVLIVLVIICKCKSKLRFSSPPENITSNSIKTM